MAMVTNKFLGAVCVKLGFYRHLRHNNAGIEHQVRTYATELLEAERTSGGAPDYWTTVNDPPKCLADMVEAYVGAVFIDSDFDYNEVQRFFDMHMKPFFEDMSIYDTFANNHPVTRLFHMLQQTYGCRESRIMADEIPSGDGNAAQAITGLMIHNEVIAGDVSKSVRYSKLRTALKAADELQGIAPYEFRRKFGCDCNVKSNGDAGDTVDGADSAAA